MITHWKPHLKKMVTLNHLKITPSYHVQSLTDKICIVFIPRFVTGCKVINKNDSYHEPQVDQSGRLLYEEIAELEIQSHYLAVSPSTPVIPPAQQGDDLDIM